MHQEVYVKDFMPLLLDVLKFSESILDIGSGTGVLLEKYEAEVVVGLEIHRPYLVHRKYRAPHIIPLNADATEMESLFLPDSFDAVTFIDSLEHFTAQDGRRMLSMAETVARRCVAVFTPRGYFPQAGVDHYHLNGEKYQKHLSGWEVQDLTGLGYSVIVLKGYHHAENPAFVAAFGEGHPPVDALLAFKTL